MQPTDKRKEYDFETLPNRFGVGAIKWDKMREKDPDVPEGVAPFSVGDMDLLPPPELVEGLREFIGKSVFGYTAPTPADRRATTEWFRRRHGWAVEPEWLVGFDGVVPALYAAVRAFTAEGDGVVYMPPVYRPIYNAIHDTRRVPVEAPLYEGTGGWEMDFPRLEEVLGGGKAKLLILCSPHNPVGRVWKPEELERLGGLCRENGVTVVSDEIHMDFTMPGYRHSVFSEVGKGFGEFSVICTAPSKTFNIAGLQVSNIVIPNRRLRTRFCEEYRGSGRHGVNQLGLAACRIAYERCEDWLEGALELVRGNGEMVREFMAAQYPEAVVSAHEGTFFLWVDFRAWGRGTEELERFMTVAARLFLDEGYVFGREGWGFERFNLATPRWVLQEGLERLRVAGRP